MQPHPLQIVKIVTGPTASGKSAYALDVAQKMDGVIINADSLQIYDALPLLTARPSPEDQAAMPHRLYAALKPDEPCTAVSWRELAQREIRAALADGRTPILVGGTGFYLKALIEGLSPIPEIPEEIRVLSDDLLDRLGVAAFYEALLEKDPETAKRLDPQNGRRLVRAWEVLVHTGHGLAHWHAVAPVAPDPDLAFDLTLVMPERDELYRRCDARFELMIDAGAVEEARAFDQDLQSGIWPIDCAVTHALGFKPLQEYFRGEMPLETAIMLGQNETRHYAKRQSTWFRNQLQPSDKLSITQIG